MTTRSDCKRVTSERGNDRKTDGWLEEHKTGGKPTKGIIIIARYDDRLYYALKKIKDASIIL